MFYVRKNTKISQEEKLQAVKESSPFLYYFFATWFSVPALGL